MRQFQHNHTAFVSVSKAVKGNNRTIRRKGGIEKGERRAGHGHTKPEKKTGGQRSEGRGSKMAGCVRIRTGVSV